MHNGAFHSVGAMLFGRNTWERDAVFGERYVDFLGAFVVEDMELCSVAVVKQFFVC